MKAGQLAIHSLSAAHRKLDGALEAYAAGVRYVEPNSPLVTAWMEDGHAVERTPELFRHLGFRFIDSSEPVVECFHASTKAEALPFGFGRRARGSLSEPFSTSYSLRPNYTRISSLR